MKQNYQSGFISIIGRPNVGKSSFLNAIIGQKVAIMSDKPQTTRNKIQGVVTQENAQFVFIDTPGVHKPKHQLGDFMVKTAQSSLNEVDAVMFMINASEGYGKGDQFIIDWLCNIDTPVFLVINKIDLVSPEILLKLIDQYRTKLDFKEVVPISVTENDNIAHLLNVLKTHLPEGPQYYPDHYVTDHPERFIISELIREKVLHFTEEEIPHSIAVIIEAIAEKDGEKMHIQATILTERSTQKGILIGKQGSMLKKIGQKARVDIENLLGTKVYLKLWVKVQKDWRNKEAQLRNLGYDEDAY